MSTHIRFGSSTDTAVARTFGVNESLENILFFLPLKDLVRARRICQQFKVVVEESNRLKYGLWLKPKEPVHYLRWKNSDVGQHPIVSDSPTVEDKQGIDEAGGVVKIVGLNPVFRAKSINAMSADSWVPSKHHVQFSFNLARLLDSVSTSALLRNMLLTDPPTASLDIRYFPLDSPVTAIGLMFKEREEGEGVKVGRLIEKLVDSIKVTLCERLSGSSSRSIDPNIYVQIGGSILNTSKHVTGASGYTQEMTGEDAVELEAESGESSEIMVIDDSGTLCPVKGASKHQRSGKRKLSAR